ncbi:MAG: DsbA family protein [Acidilobus sp.]
MRGRSITRNALVFLVVIVVIIGAALYLGMRSYYVRSSARPAITTTQPQQQNVTLLDILSMPNISETPSLGPTNTSKVIVIVYDPECPFCALELNATLPFLYYISMNTSQARVLFLGLPIHEFSFQMLEVLDAIYNKYGPKAFLEVLDENYAFYVYWIIQYEEGKTSQLIMPTNQTLIEMADSLGYNVTQAQAEEYEGLVNGTTTFLLKHGITATPIVLAYNGLGGPVYVQVGLTNPQYLICNLTERLSLRVPGVSC